MNFAELDIVLGLLVHSGGLSQVDVNSKQRIIDSIAPVDRSIGIWQARDNYVGASWIIGIGYNQIERLCSPDGYGEVWREYKPSTVTEIIETNRNSVIRVKAIIASFHDTKHDVAPAALLRLADNYIYRNVSGHVVPIKSDAVREILEINNIK
jgi:hypothetical protein